MRNLDRRRSILAIMQIGILSLYFVVVLVIDKVYFEATRWEWSSWSIASMNTFLWSLTSLGGILACHFRTRSYLVVLAANGFFVLTYQSYFFALEYLKVEPTNGIYWLGLAFLVDLLVGLFLPKVTLFLGKRS